MFGDLTIYTDSILNYCRHGINPYTAQPVNGLAFIYPPIFLHVMALFGELAPYVLWSFFIGSFLFCFWAMFKKIGAWAVLPMICTGFAIKSGNLAIAMHLFLFGMMLESQQKKQTAFNAMVVIFSLIKPYFLSYLVIHPIQKLINKEDKAIPLIKKLLVPIAVVVAVYVGSYVVWHNEFIQFATRANSQIIGMDDMGCNLVGILWRNGATSNMVLSLVHIGYITIVAWIIINLFKNNYVVVNYESYFLKTNGTFWVIYAVIANPRMKDYDSFMISLCLIFFIVLFIKNKKQLKSTSSSIIIKKILGTGHP